MVGGLQEHAIAGVAITNQFFFIFTVLLFGIGGTAGIFMPQFKGIGNEQKMTEIFRISLLFSFAVGLCFFLLMQFTPDLILRIFAGDPQTLVQAHLYLRYIRYSFLIFPISMAIMSAFRFSGYVRLPMYIAIITVAVSVFFNYGLIHGNLGMPAMGVEGAGLATLIARVVEMTVAIALTIYLKSPIKVSIRRIFDFEKKLLTHFIKRGYGLVLNEFFWVSGMQFLTVLYTQRISVNIAAMSISSAIANLIFIGMGGMSVAMSIILGEHLGQGHFEQAKADAKKLLKVGAFVGLTFGTIVFFLSFALLGFYDVAPETLSTARLLIFINVAFSWLYYLNAGFYFVMRAGGDTRSVLLIDSGFMWVITVPVAFLIGRLDFVLPLHFFLTQLVELPKFLVAIRMYRKNTWLNNLTLVET